MLLICDLDNSLADAKWRMVAAGEEPSRLKQAEYDIWLSKLQPEDALLADSPIKGMQKLVNALSGAFHVIYLTGRSERVREATQRWLIRHDFPSGPIYMRSLDDYRTAKEYKSEQLMKILDAYRMDAITIDDDSDSDCEDIYRKLGITHLKVTNNL